MGIDRKEYRPLPTMRGFHASDAEMRCLVGPVGSGKTTACIQEIAVLLPRHIANTYGITETRWCICRKTYRELMDTTFASVQDWLPFGEWHAADMTMVLNYPPSVGCNYSLHVELVFRSCNRPEDMEKFKSLEITGYWVEESVEVNEEVKRMLRGRIGRYPRKCPVRFGIESTNPCDVEHQIYWEHNWVPTGPEWEAYRQKGIAEVKQHGMSIAQAKILYPDKTDEQLKEITKQQATKEEALLLYPETCNPNYLEKDIIGRFEPWCVPGPRPSAKKKPVSKYLGWWQPPHENDPNLKPGYYDALMEDYGNNPEWLHMYVEGKPGIRVLGKVVYGNFLQSRHVSKTYLESNGTPLYLGWDNSGNFPAAVVLQIRGPLQVAVLWEFYSEREGIIDFTKNVLANLEQMYPGYVIAANYADPAGGGRFSRGMGGLTSNAQLMWEECGLTVIPSEQNLYARIQSVDQMLIRNDGIIIDPRCTRLINGFIGGYVYPEKIGVANEFQQSPMKNQWSHCFTGDTLVLTPRGEVRIDQIQIGDIVTTPKGPRRVTATMNRIVDETLEIEFTQGKVRCTKDHPFILPDGVAQADTLRYDSIVIGHGTREEKEWIINNTKECATISELRATIRRTIAAIMGTCTGLSGSLISVIFPKAIVSIIGMETKATMELGTFSSCLYLNTHPCMSGNGYSKIQKLSYGESRQPKRKPRNGIVQRRGDSGTASIGKSNGKMKESRDSIASNAVRSIGRILHRASVDFALWLANNEFAEESIRVKSLNTVSGQVRVYDLTVDKEHCFYVNHCLVMNCHDALQYACAKLFSVKSRKEQEMANRQIYTMEKLREDLRKIEDETGDSRDWKRYDPEGGW